jgi:hypothetical protein
MSHTTVPISGFVINEKLDGDYVIQFQKCTINVKKEDLKTFRDHVAGLGLYPTTSFLGYAGEWQEGRQD